MSYCRGEKSRTLLYCRWVIGFSFHHTSILNCFSFSTFSRVQIQAGRDRGRNIHSQVVFVALGVVWLLLVQRHVFQLLYPGIMTDFWFFLGRIRLMSHIRCRIKGIVTPFRWVLKSCCISVNVSEISLRYAQYDKDEFTGFFSFALELWDLATSNGLFHDLLLLCCILNREYVP